MSLTEKVIELLDSGLAREEVIRRLVDEATPTEKVDYFDQHGARSLVTYINGKRLHNPETVAPEVPPLVNADGPTEPSKVTRQSWQARVQTIAEKTHIESRSLWAAFDDVDFVLAHVSRLRGRAAGFHRRAEIMEDGVYRIKAGDSKLLVVKEILEKMERM